jgi:hypothetical protein
MTAFLEDAGIAGALGYGIRHDQEEEIHQGVEQTYSRGI